MIESAMVEQVHVKYLLNEEYYATIYNTEPENSL